MGSLKLRFVFVCALIGALMSMSYQAKSQGIEHESLSGENAAAELRQSGVDQPYNLRLGPVTLRVDADVTTGFSDNINLAHTGRIEDLTITPAAILHTRWAVSDLNTINLNLGIGYQTYVEHSEYNDLLLSPDSEADFNFFIGEVALKVHDGLSYQQDPTQIGQLSNTVRLTRFQNTAGIGATWDLSDIVVSLDYDHANLWVTNSLYNYLTNQSDTLTPRVTFKVNESTKAGLNLSVSHVRYQQSFENDYKSLSVGPFVNAAISENLSVEAQAGGYFSDYASGGGNGDSQNVASFYGSVGINHRINKTMQESLTVGREFIPGLTSNFTERVYTNYAASWQATASLNASANLFWENLSDSNASVREDSNRYGIGFTFNDYLTEHFILNLNYQFILKDANPSAFSYYQNMMTVGFSYRF